MSVDSFSADGQASAPFSGLRVVELANGPAGELTALHFVHLGAEVVKIEPPEGAPSRHIGPFVDDTPDVEKSLNYWYYNGGKQSTVVDLASAAGRAVFDDLLKDADVFILEGHPHEFRELDLDPSAIAARHKRLIVVSITPFGLTGPWADYLSSDLVALAAAGLLHLSGYDDHSLPPIRPSGNQSFHIAASFAHQAAVLALIERLESGVGGLLDLSIQEAAAVTVEGASLYWFYPRVRVSRQTCRHAQPRPTQPAVFHCADGGSVYVLLTIAEEHTWSSLVGWLVSHDFAAGLDDPIYLDSKYRQSQFPHIQGVVEAFLLLLDAPTAFREGQEWGLPVGIMNRPEDLYSDPHIQARGVFQPVDEPGYGELTLPASPYRFSAFQTRPPMPAQPLGGG